MDPFAPERLPQCREKTATRVQLQISCVSQSSGPMKQCPLFVLDPNVCEIYVHVFEDRRKICIIDYLTNIGLGLWAFPLCGP